MPFQELFEKTYIEIGGESFPLPHRSMAQLSSVLRFYPKRLLKGHRALGTVSYTHLTLPTSDLV